MLALVQKDYFWEVPDKQVHKVEDKVTRVVTKWVEMLKNEVYWAKAV